MLMKDDKPLTDIVGEVEKIPALVAKLLKVANSVYYSTRKSVSTVREAVMFIGTEYIVSLVTAIEAFQSVSKGTDAKASHEIDVMWGQALRRASIAKMIGERWEGVKDPQVPYVVSLLQDIGLVIRLCSEPEKYYRFKQLSSGQISRYEADMRIFTTPHDELGAALLEFWNFPSEIVDAVKKHHRPAGDNVLVQIVQIAEALSCYDRLNPHDPAIDALIPQWRENLGHELSTILTTNLK
jgi:HD-like signal output (HDOD) protein